LFPAVLHELEIEGLIGDALFELAILVLERLEPR